jgi:hypothetical protein
MLDNLHDGRCDFRAWTGDPANQERMINFFVRMRDDHRSSRCLGKLAGRLSGPWTARTSPSSPALDTLRQLGPPIGTMSSTRSGTPLATSSRRPFQNFVNMLVSWPTAGVLGTLTSALSNLFAIISQLLQIPGIGPLLAFGAGLLAIFKTVSLLWTVLGPVVRSSGP